MAKKVKSVYTEKSKDNSKGHTYDNVVPCCYVCNCARNNNFTFEEMKQLGKTIKSIMDQRKLLKV